MQLSNGTWAEQYQDVSIALNYRWVPVRIGTARSVIFAGRSLCVILYSASERGCDPLTGFFFISVPSGLQAAQPTARLVARVAPALDRRASKLWQAPCAQP
jgi:hypothetical protein